MQPDRFKITRSHTIRHLELLQDFIVVSLCIALFLSMLVELRDMYLSLLRTTNAQEVTSDTLILLILVELFRLLVIYLQRHRISVRVAVEVAIVSVLREVIVRGLLELPWSQILAACAFLLVLGVLLQIRPSAMQSESVFSSDLSSAEEKS
jgi:uncharacterized membrane protein (DUF373 family)